MVAFIATCLPEHRRLPHEIRDEIRKWWDVFREKRDGVLFFLAEKKLVQLRLAPGEN
jgi:hypothetical protein